MSTIKSFLPYVKPFREDIVTFDALRCYAVQDYPTQTAVWVIAGSFDTLEQAKAYILGPYSHLGKSKGDFDFAIVEQKSTIVWNRVARYSKADLKKAAKTKTKTKTKPGSTGSIEVSTTREDAERFLADGEPVGGTLAWSAKAPDPLPRPKKSKATKAKKR